MTNQSASIGELTIAGNVVEMIHHEGRPYLSVTDITRGLGVDTAGQLRTIRDNKLLSRGLHETGNSKTLRAYLRFDLVLGWLSGLSLGRISAESAAKAQQFADDLDALSQRAMDRSFGQHPAEVAMRENQALANEIAGYEDANRLTRQTVKQMQARIRENERAIANLKERLYISLDVVRIEQQPEPKKLTKGGRK